MRRLISVLAAGLLAAGTVLTAGGAASAAPAAARQPGCLETYSGPFWVTVGSVSYYLGTPRNLSPGAAAILKPKQNDTTLWNVCIVGTTVPAFVLSQNGLALTSRSSSPGADVTMEPVGNGGTGFASQQWPDNYMTSGYNQFPNAKTGLFLRIRNGGPVMGQTVTTGSAPTDWQVP